MMHSDIIQEGEITCAWCKSKFHFKYKYKDGWGW